MKRLFLYALTIIALLSFGNIIFAMPEPKDPELIEAIQGNNLDRVTQLLQQGANPDIINQFQMTPLHHTIQYGDRDEKNKDKKAELLLAYKADVNAQDCDKQTPIIYASLYSYPTLIPRLLQRGAHLDHTDKYLHTALSYAVLLRRLEVLEVILSNKFQRPNLRYGPDNSTHVLDLARSEGLKEPYVDEILNKEWKQRYQKIGKAIIVFEGFWTGRSLIARKGLAQWLPIDIAKYAAAHFDYKSILFPQSEAKATNKP